MNPRRAKSVKLVSSHSQPIEVEIVECPQMSSSVDNTVYCCVAKGNKIIYSYNSKDHELENLAIRCLENAPYHHTWYFHTVGMRTFGFLTRDGYTYFAIVEPSMGNLAILQFLEHVRDGFRKVSKNGFDDDMVPIIKRLIASLEKMPKQSDWMDENFEGPTSSDGSASSKAPLLGKSNARHHDKKTDKVIEDDDKLDDHADRAVRIDVPTEMAAMSLQRSLSSGRLRAQQARRLWCRQVGSVIVTSILFRELYTKEKQTRNIKNCAGGKMQFLRYHFSTNMPLWASSLRFLSQLLA